MQYKTCSKCSVSKELHHFYRDKRYSLGCKGVCKECQSSQQQRRNAARTDMCEVHGCTRRARVGALCSMHDTRVRRHGQVGSCRPLIGGDQVGYIGMHTRIRNARGSAVEFACVDCGGSAAEWSYDHACLDERQSDQGPYSLNIDRYVPRCKSCHTTFDHPSNRQALTGGHR